jgi:cyclophilin family peptidyl-prolyl cis-trans isomerase/HEAT repeat protein
MDPSWSCGAPMSEPDPIRPQRHAPQPARAGRRARGGLALALGLLLALPAGCGGTRVRGFGSNSADETIVGARIELATHEDALEILALEAGRSLGGGRLLEFLSHEQASTRARAALALGRMPLERYGREVTEALCTALADPAPVVRATAAFALGQRRDASAAGLMLASWNDAEPAVRARIVEAASRFQDEALRARVVQSLDDPALEVRLEATVGIARWQDEGAAKRDADRALINVLSPMSPAAAERPLDDELRWRVLYALQQRSSEAGQAAFLEHSEWPEPTARLFAIRGLARIPVGEAGVRALERALSDPDWRIACEAALGLATHRDPASADLLAQALQHPSAHVRRRVLEALGAFRAQRDKVIGAVLRGTRDASAGVRAAALDAIARLSDGGAAAAELENHARDVDPVVRAGVARAARQLPADAALGLLLPLSADRQTLVARAAIEALGGVDLDEARARLTEVLTGSPDAGLRQAALGALEAHLVAGRGDLLEKALEGQEGHEARELWRAAVRIAGRIGDDDARGLVLRATSHPLAAVRTSARQVLAESFPLSVDDAAPEPEAEGADWVPVPGRDHPLWRTNPIVEVETTRGRLIFELLAADAPLHVHNFLVLAERGTFDGRSFHRVEPNFVVQGASPRGDGAGGLAWTGAPLPQEFGPRRYQRGALGMPRTDDPDSGGSQFFVTHRATPHLDGNYTLFGELRSGFSVLDRIEMGDRILSVRQLR